jgi:Lipocalin-like
MRGTCLVGVVIGLGSAACSSGGLPTPGAGGGNPSQTSNPLGSSGTVKPGGNGGTTPGATLNGALVGNWVEESDEMTGSCENINGFSFDSGGQFSFSEDPENDNCATVETSGQWSTAGSTLVLDTESSNCGPSCSQFLGTVDWTFQVTSVTLTLCAPGETSGCITYEADDSSP